MRFFPFFLFICQIRWSFDLLRINSTIFCHAGDKSEPVSRRLQTFCPGPSPYTATGLLTCKFHGSFRKYSSTPICMENIIFKANCHTATFTDDSCYTRISPLQGKPDYLALPSLEQLPHSSVKAYSPTGGVYCSGHELLAFDCFIRKCHTTQL